MPDSGKKGSCRPLLIILFALQALLVGFATSASADAVIRATYETGDTSSGISGIGLAGCCTYSLTVDSSLARTGSDSLRSDLKYGDTSAGGPRAESDAESITATRFQPGQTYWYGFSVYIPSTWQADTAEDIIFQWHHTKSSCDDPNRSPSMFLEVLPATSTAASLLRLRVNSDPVLCDYQDNASAALSKTSYNLATLTTGVWHDFVFQVNWQYTQTGSIKAWHQTSKATGWTQVLDAENVANTYNDASSTYGYLKWGIYKPAWRDGATAITERVVWHDNVAAAADSDSGFDDVDPTT
ncbi:polysaccharide lyase [Streptomyces sp. NPDC088812]|uniref:polysaccharide lyase n=1 Tax=Streptomyces sp. NPDC088812 TaxID=3365905 RepID=UPI0037F648FA